MPFSYNHRSSVSNGPNRYLGGVLSPKRSRSIAAMVLFSAILLFGQAVDLGHNHNGKLQAQFDCDVCLVTGSLSDALHTGEIGLDFSRNVNFMQSGTASHVSFFAVPHQARAPPSLS